MFRRTAVAILGAAVLILGGALLRGWLVPASRADLAPEAYGFRLRWPWAPSAEVTVYFPLADSGDAPWVAVRRAVPQATPLVALRELAAGPAPGSGPVRAVPAGLQVKGVTLTGDQADVQVDGPAADDSLVLGAFARTLAAGPFGVKSVKLERPDGRSAGPQPVVDGFAGGSVTYLWRGLPVPVAAPLPNGPDRPAAAVQRLLAGPAPDGIDGPPGGVSLLSVTVAGDLARVNLGLSPDLTTELTAGRWLFAPYAMSVVDTLTDQPGIRRVQFDFPNLPAEARRNCKTPLGVPLVRPDAEQGRAQS